MNRNCRFGSTMRCLMILLTATAFCSVTCEDEKQEEDPCPSSHKIYPCYCFTDSVDYSSVSCEKVSDMNHIRNVLELTKGKKISLDFTKARLGDLPSDFFQGQKSTDLSFENCEIGSFGTKPFSGLEDTLENLHIYGSIDKRKKDLETLPLGHLKKLHSFLFQANDIKRLGNDWFEGGPVSLVELSLEANDIEELGDKAFASLVNVEQIWLGDNRFKAVKRTMFPRPATNLQILEISFCEIESFPEDIFADMPKLRVINISGNKFTSLPETTYGGVFNQLEELYVGRSRLLCDDKLKWMFERKLPRILDGRCSSGNALGGKKLEDLTLKDFQ